MEPRLKSGIWVQALIRRCDLAAIGVAVVARGDGDPSAATALTVVVAQLTMIPMALLAARLAQARGYWLVFVMALAALPLRGLIAASLSGFWVIIPVQVLDGVGAGLLGVALMAVAHFAPTALF